jgi:hypothetical protein
LVIEEVSQAVAVGAVSGFSADQVRSSPAVTSLQLSDDVLVSGSDDGEVKVWDFGPAVSSKAKAQWG